MHLHFEHCIHANSNASISTISWMGKVPDESPEEHGWKLNRVNYYQEGWLATGNAANVIGVTFTTSHCKRSSALPSRTNYNLRGHRSEVIFVKWNEPYQKLASCDSSGVIFVWFKYDGRWSIELINDRNTPVTHFSWSHEGRMALICYQDGFVLVGSVAGQRYWSSMLNLEATITTGVWSPDDQLVYLGTNNGQIIAMNLNGAMMGEFQLSYESGIISMTMFCENFKMEDDEPTNSNRQNQNAVDRNKHNHLLAVSFQNGTIYFVKANDDVNPIKIENDFCGLPYVMEWSNAKQVLAVSGVQSISRRKIETDGNGTTYGETVYKNVVKFFTETGALLLQSTIPNKQYPVTAMAWGHNGKRLFIATGNEIHIAWVSRKVSSLQQLSRFVIYDLIEKESLLYQLPMPIRTRYTISKLFVPTIKCCVPENQKLREFVSRPPMPITNSTRLHCTMIKHFSSGDPVYGLYLEYLGSLFLILVGKKISKLKPEFLIFDTQTALNKSNNENEYELRVNDSIFAKKSLPEELCLAHVTSNLWGTKFKIHGLIDSIPTKLGHIQYKASFLHLQPRQMTITVYEFRDELPNFPEASFSNSGTVNCDEYSDRQGNKRNTNFQQSNYSLKPLIAKVSTVSSNRNKSSEEPSKELCSSPSILVINPVIRSYSVGFLETSDVSTAGSSSVPSKRLVLTQETQNKKSKNEIDIDDLLFTINENRRCNKSISLDIAELKAKKYHMNSEKDEIKQIVSNEEPMFDNETINLISKSTPATPQLPKKRLNMRNFASTSSSIIKNSFLNSPFLNRKHRQKNPSVILEDFDAINEAEYDFADSTIDNEFDQKLLRNNESPTESSFVDRQPFFRKSKKYKNYRVHLKDNEMPSKKVNVFEMQNKTPIWNETSQVYQLDFGGRVTQESAKNFQIEFQGKQVMQFGRIDENQFTLDYQHPFSALQAFSVALASITQRLK